MSDYKTYDEIFIEAWQEVMAPENMLPRILAPKFEELGISLTEKQLAEIVDQALLEGDSFDFELDDSQYVRAGFLPDKDGKYDLTIDLSDEAERLDKLEEELPKIIFELVQKFTEEWATELREHVKGTEATLLQEQRENRDKIRGLIQTAWGDALDSLDVFIDLVTESGWDFANEYYTSGTLESDYKFQALIGLHSRACQISKEISVLLADGFADGAHARWRSLHEIAVIANFILDNNQDLAERYLLHDVVESRRGARQHKKYADKLNEPPPTEDELARLDEEYQLLEERFGKSYLTPYGWASELLGSRYPNFADIEKATGLDHLRPYYRLASHNVHANSTGILYRLGVDPEDPVLLAGPSILGLADPGHGAAISLLWVTTWLLTYKPTIDRNVRLHALMKMMDEIGDAFYRIHWSLLSSAGKKALAEEE